MRLRTEVIGAINIFLTRPGALSEADIALGQGLADIATIGLLQERLGTEKNVLADQLESALSSRVLIEQAKGIFAERHQVTVPTAFATVCAHARNTGQPLRNVATQVIDGTFGATATTRS